MRAANSGSATTCVLVLLALGVALSFAGYNYREQQRSKHITWQHVNSTLLEVEVAKHDLFRSLGEKAGS